MARLDHPNIVGVYGGCLSPPNLFVVEELMVGDLSAVIHRRKSEPLPLETVLRISLNIIAGLVRAVIGFKVLTPGHGTVSHSRI
jgi:mitogen-activated protein kinase kinase kinase 7